MRKLGQEDEPRAKCENYDSYATAATAGSPALGAAIWLLDCYGDDVASWAADGAARAGRTVAEYVNYWFDNEDPPPLHCVNKSYRQGNILRTYPSCVTPEGRSIHCTPDEVMERVGIFVPHARRSVRRGAPPIADRVCLSLLSRPPEGCPSPFWDVDMRLVSDSPRARLRRRFAGLRTQACATMVTPRPGPTYRPTAQDMDREAAWAVTGATRHGLMAESRTRIESAQGLVSSPKGKASILPWVVVAAVLAVAWRARRG